MMMMNTLALAKYQLVNNYSTRHLKTNAVTLSLHFEQCISLDNMEDFTNKSPQFNICCYLKINRTIK